SVTASYSFSLSSFIAKSGPSPLRFDAPLLFFYFVFLDLFTPTIDIEPQYFDSYKKPKQRTDFTQYAARLKKYIDDSCIFKSILLNN
ncbi:MAG: hypothetical protein IJY93_02995, partial [Clostridia bacterium]|nr:hypothetical protein [Clostridia bacterium]